MKKRKLGGAIYILPNLVTTGNLFFGFFSIVKGLQGDFYQAAIAILLAAVFDLLDGRVARLTGATSEFGVQYDSLCDLVSFGAAPALLMYNEGLHAAGRIGWIICFMFMACGALRLARFNVQSAIETTGTDFVGLPIPMSAAVIACFVALSSSFKVSDGSMEILFIFESIIKNPTFKIFFYAISGVVLALTMVTNVPYRSFKKLDIKGIKPFKLLVAIVILMSFIAYEPELFGFIFFLGYALSGPIEWLLGRTKLVDDDDIFSTSHDIMDPEEN